MRTTTDGPLPVLIIVGIGELEPTEWVTVTLKKLGRAARGRYVVSDGSLAAELLAVGHKGLHQVYAPGEYWRPTSTRMRAASPAWLRSKFRTGWLTHMGHDWSVEAINATWVRFRYEEHDIVVVSDGSGFARRMTGRYVETNRTVIEVLWRQERVIRYDKIVGGEGVPDSGRDDRGAGPGSRAVGDRAGVDRGTA